MHFYKNKSMPQLPHFPEETVQTVRISCIRKIFKLQQLQQNLGYNTHQMKRVAGPQTWLQIKPLKSSRNWRARCDMSNLIYF